jgi:hypothetical protein
MSSFKFFENLDPFQFLIPANAALTRGPSKQGTSASNGLIGVAVGGANNILNSFFSNIGSSTIIKDKLELN